MGMARARGTLRRRASESAGVRLAAAAAALALVYASGEAFAIGGPGATATANHPYVGRVQDETTPLGTHYGTGSFIRDSVVLTAGHCVNDTLANVTEPVFERFQLVGGPQRFALGVQHPGYSPVGLSTDDQGLLLILNASNPASYGKVWTGGGGFPVVNQNVEIVGFTSSAPGGNPLSGTMKVNSIAADIITYEDNNEHTQGGDSGGPHFFDFGAGPEIVTTTRSGNAHTNPGAGNFRTDGVRTDTAAHQGFINGDGSGGSRVLDRLGGTPDTNFATATSWFRGSTNANTAPGASDVAILDPNTASNVATIVTVDANTANLDGMLTDVTLQISGATMTVGGSTGVLNGGVINVGAGGGSALSVGHAIDNEGTINVKNLGTLTAGASVPNHPSASFINTILNGANATLTVEGGGTMTIANANQFATLRNLQTATLNVQGSFAGVGNATLDAIDNSGAVQVFSGGNLNLNAVTLNDANGTITVSGGGFGNGTISGALDNDGTLTVNNGGVANFTRPNTLVAGDALSQRATGNITVNSGGALNATAGGNAPVGNAITAETSSITTINAGGTATFAGKSLMNGSLRVNGGPATGGVVNVTGTGGNRGELFVGGDGDIDFTGGTVAPEIRFNDADLVSTGSYDGNGTLRFENESNFDNRTVGALTAGLNMRNIGVIFDGATITGGGFVNMETTSDDDGAEFAGFLGDFALRELCIIDASSVSLIDQRDNEGGISEVIYTDYFGISADSTLDLAGLTIYYQHLDLDCGGLAGTIIENGGALILVPEPAALGVLSLLGVVALRRRRA